MERPQPGCTTATEDFKWNLFWWKVKLSGFHVISLAVVMFMWWQMFSNLELYMNSAHWLCMKMGGVIVTSPIMTLCGCVPVQGLLCDTPDHVEELIAYKLWCCMYSFLVFAVFRVIIAAPLTGLEYILQRFQTFLSGTNTIINMILRHRKTYLEL